MCETIGIKGVSDLFRSISGTLRLKNSLPLPKALPEQELIAHLKALSRTNETVDHYTSFLGAGAYHHYIPVAVGALIGRGEFTTSYTPYQAELSQGTLQAIFEFQTMVASLMGMEIANASNYDGATALAEAALMAIRLRKKKKVILARSIHPEYRQVVKTALRNLGDEIVEVGWDGTGRVDPKALSGLLSEETSALCVQSPNFFGVVEDVSGLSKTAHDREVLLVAATGDPVSLGLLAPPGSCGADIAVGEGQSFGNFLNFGGPYLGLFATKKEFVRQMPGRLAGETVDHQGNRGFILTLNTREQHIRREKATSNICTNQSLCALAAAVHLALLGPSGLKKLAEINFAKARYIQDLLLRIPGVQKMFGGEIFNEFAVRLPRPVNETLAALQQRKIFGGFPLERYYPELKEGLLVCATEMNSKEQMDRFAEELGKISA
jgi:glycine cleavage system P protein (glycine dehydrogenase) subunit 1